MKRQKLAEEIKTHDPTICCPEETHFKSKATTRLKVKEWKKIFHANRNKRCSTSLNNREMQIKTMRYHIILIRIATIKKKKITNIGKYVEKLEPLCIASGNKTW